MHAVSSASDKYTLAARPGQVQVHLRLEGNLLPIQKTEGSQDPNQGEPKNQDYTPSCKKRGGARQRGRDRQTVTKSTHRVERATHSLSQKSFTAGVESRKAPRTLSLRRKNAHRSCHLNLERPAASSGSIKTNRITPSARKSEHEEGEVAWLELGKAHADPQRTRQV